MPWLGLLPRPPSHGAGCFPAGLCSGVAQKIQSIWQGIVYPLFRHAHRIWWVCIGDERGSVLARSVRLTQCPQASADPLRILWLKITAYDEMQRSFTLFGHWKSVTMLQHSGS